MKRKLSMLFCFLSIAAVAVTSTACGQKTEVETKKEVTAETNDTVKTEGTDEVASNEKVVFPLAEQITLKVWIPFASTYMKEYGENVVQQKRQELSNIKFEFIHPAADQAAENFNILIASNDLPDVFQSPPAYPGGEDKAISDGVYVGLNDYMSDYAPNYLKVISSNKDIEKQVKTDSGNFVGFNCIQLTEEAPWHGLITRKDWIDELNGGKMPETIDELYNYLVKIRDEKNAVPLTLANANDYFIFESGAITSAFDVTTNWFNKNGVATFGPIQPEFKEFLTLMNKWYNEGLFEKEFATREWQSVGAMFTNGESGVKAASYGEFEGITTAAKQVSDNFSVYALKNVGLTKDQPIHFRQTNSYSKGSQAYITTANKHVKETIALYDYNYSDDGFLLYNYGVEGVSWEWADGPVSDMDKPYFPETLRNLDKHPEFNSFMTANPDGTPFWTLVEKYKIGQEASLRDPMAFGSMGEDVQQAMKVWGSVGNDWMMPTIMQTDAEAKEMSTALTDIDVYVKTSITNFIMGNEPIDKFDDFVQQVKAMNFDLVQKNKQAALDRYINK